MSMDERKEVKKELEATVKKLAIFIAEAEGLSSAIHTVTAECCQKILTYPKYHMYYLKEWFCRMLAVKDECLVLNGGELYRSYHREMHAGYFHNRGREQQFFKTDTLSKCSLDGINYEYRKNKAKYKTQVIYGVGNFFSL